MLTLNLGVTELGCDDKCIHALAHRNYSAGFGVESIAVRLSVNALILVAIDSDPW